MQTTSCHFIGREYFSPKTEACPVLEAGLREEMQAGQGFFARRQPIRAAIRQYVRLIYRRGNVGKIRAHTTAVWMAAQTGDTTMFIKTTIALALILATASGALAATKKHSTNGGFEAYG